MNNDNEIRRADIERTGHELSITLGGDSTRNEQRVHVQRACVNSVPHSLSKASDQIMRSFS